MKKLLFRLSFCTLVLAFCPSVEAQQPSIRIPHIGFLQRRLPQLQQIPIHWGMHFGKGCEILVMSTGKAL